MRRVHLRYGLKQRINDIIGADAGAAVNGVPPLTTWSVQAAMISNFNRIIHPVERATACIY